MADFNLSPLKPGSQTNAKDTNIDSNKVSNKIWQNFLTGAGTLALLATLLGCGAKNIDKRIGPINPENSGIVATEPASNSSEDQVKGSQSIIVHAGVKKEDPDSNTSQEAPQETISNNSATERTSTVKTESRAEQIYQEILKDGGYIPNALRNNVRGISEDIPAIFADINMVPDSPLIDKDGHRYLAVGQGAMLYIYYNCKRTYRTGNWSRLTGGILHFNITDMPAGAAVHSFVPLRNMPETNFLMPNTLVDLMYVKDPTKNVVYNTTTFMEEVSTTNNQVVSHVTQLADLDGNGKFDRVYEGYSLPMSRTVGADDLLMLASANGISHELYDLYHNSDFNEVLEKAPECFKTETASGTYEYKIVTKTDVAIEYKLTRESYERNRGENISAEQRILNMSSNWIPYHFVITTNGRICQATFSIGQDWGSEIMYGRTFSDGKGDGLFRWADSRNPDFGWVDRIPGIIQSVEESYETLLAD